MKKFLLAGAAAFALLAGRAEATISSPTVQVVDLGNGSTTVFNYSFLIPFQADGVTPAVTVQTEDPNGNIATLNAGQYSISGVGSSAGGSVTYNPGSPLPSGWSLIITRSLAYIQPIAVTNYSFYPHTVEVSADNLEAQIQQLNFGLVTASFAPIVTAGALAHFANNTALAAASPALKTVVRDNFAGVGDGSPPVTYAYSSSACGLNGGAGDGGSQVPSSLGGCWNANFSGFLDATAFGVSYPIQMYTSIAGSDLGGNYCLSSAHPCTAQNAISRMYLFNAKNQAPTINFAAGTYDTSLFAAGQMPGFPTTFGSANGAFIQLIGAGSGTTKINPTVGGGGCAQAFGDGITLSNQAVFRIDQLTLATTCTSRSGAFLQNGAYLVPGPDVVWGSAPASFVHVEAQANFEVPATSPFTIDSGAIAAAAVSFSNGTVNFDGGEINFNGNATFTSGFIFGDDGGVAQLLQGTTINLNGHTVTGPQYSVVAESVILNQSGSALPGSLAGAAGAAALYWDNAGTIHFGQVGSASGTGSGPTPLTTNLLLYFSTATNYAGWMATTTGDICGVAGTSAPASLFCAMHDGGLIAPWSVTGGDEGAGTLNISGPYYESGTAGATCSGSPTSSFASKGGIVTHC